MSASYSNSIVLLRVIVNSMLPPAKKKEREVNHQKILVILSILPIKVQIPLNNSFAASSTASTSFFPSSNDAKHRPFLAPVYIFLSSAIIVGVLSCNGDNHVDKE